MEIPTVLKANKINNDRDIKFFKTLAKYWFVFGLGIVIETFAAQIAIGTDNWGPTHIMGTIGWMGVTVGIATPIIVYVVPKVVNGINAVSAR